jgi:hypothetical protein
VLESTQHANPSPTCSFQQYIGAQTLVRPDGTVLLFAERIFADYPNCTLAPPRFEQDMFTSTDGGQSWGPRVKIADVTPPTPFGVLDLAPGQAIRTIEFPTIAASGGTV